MQKRERKRDEERGRDLLVESRQSMTCGQPEGVFMWKKERERKRSLLRWHNKVFSKQIAVAF